MAQYNITFITRKYPVNVPVTYPSFVVEEGKQAADYAPTVNDYIEGAYTYKFSGWEPELGPVKADTVYTAVFEKVYNAPPLQRIVETYGKQIDLAITRTKGEETKASGETVLIDEPYTLDTSLSVTVKRKNLLDLGQYSAKAYAVLDADNKTVTSNFTDFYYSYLEFTYLNDLLMTLRGQPLTFSVKSIPEGTMISWIVYGTRTSGKTNQEISSYNRETSGILSEDFTAITKLELRVNRKGTTHTAESVVFEELQFEVGDTATAYTPYIADLSAVNVRRTKKNLLDVSKATKISAEKVSISGNTVTIAPGSGLYGIKLLDCVPKLEVGKTYTLSVGSVSKHEAQWGFRYRGASGTYSDVNKTTKRTFTVTEPIINLWFYVGFPLTSEEDITITDIQCELGEEATAYEEYTAETATANADGLITTLATTAPVTVLSSDTHGAILDVLYKRAIKTTYTSADVVGCNISYSGALLTSIMREADIELQDVGKADFAAEMKGESLDIVLTVTANGESAQKDFGTFFVKDSEYDDDTNSVKLTCYDHLLFSMVPYVQTSDFTSTVTLGDFLRNICNHLGIELATKTFNNSNVIIDGEKYDDQYTFRDVLTEIAQAAGGTIAMKDGALQVLYPTETSIVLSPSNMKTVTIGEKYGKVGKVVLARTPQNDNIAFTVVNAGPAVVTIENNQLMDSHRDDFRSVGSALFGLEYYPFEVESFGILCLEPCDVFILQDLNGTDHKTIFLSSELEITQGLIETASAGTPSGTKEDYEAASSTDRAINKTNLRVNKQEQEIEAIVSTTTQQYNELKGITEELTRKAELSVTADDVTITVTEAINGIDAIETSTGYKFDHDGLYIHKDGDEIENKIDNTGMYVNRDDENILTANHEGVEAINLASRQFLIIGANSRFEDYEGNRTACFYIGG